MATKCKKIHIGIFFDGTGNHKNNDRPLGKMSNIAKLSDLYVHGKITNWSNETCDHFGHMFYKEGVGTGGGMDTVTGGGAGSGGAKRINEVIDTLFKLMDKKGPYRHISDDPNTGYSERIINVFGFSRGAALARDFVNTFYTRNNKKFKLKGVAVNYVGVYDTVGSFGKAGDDINFKPLRPDEDTETLLDNDDDNPNYEAYNFNMATYSAKYATHIVANDEKRFNFPLSHCLIGGDKFVEWMYGGVHSDIGGGYLPSETEMHKIETSGTKAKYHELKKRFPNLAFTVGGFNDQTEIGRKAIERLDARRVVLIHSREWTRTVNNEISFVTLHRMHEDAVSKGVPFRPLPRDALHQLNASMRAYDAHTQKSRASAISFAQMPFLRLTHCHRSAIDQRNVDTFRKANDMAESIKSPTRYVRTAKGELVPERAKFANRAGLAVVPVKL
mgnify:CR=1 FL=1